MPNDCDQPVARQRPLVPPGYCKEGCGGRLSVANTNGICDSCMDDAARLRRRRQTPGAKFCRKCGGEYWKHGLCHTHYNEYHQQAYQRRKAEHSQGVTAV